MVQSTITLIVFVFIIILFASNKFPLWVAAFIGLLLMTITGSLTPIEALSGFANPNAIIMMSMFIVSAGLNRTQMIKKISDLAYKISGGSFTKGLLGYILVTFLLAQVVPSASTVFIICYPLVADFCRKMGVSPSKAIFSIGLTAISIVGLLPIGNGAVMFLEMNGILEAYGVTEYTYGIFDLFKARLPMNIALIIYSAFFASKFLPDKGDLLEETQGKSVNLERPPLDHIREVIGYGVFFVVVLGLLFESYLPINSWQICLTGALIVICTGVLSEKEALGSIMHSPIFLYIGALAIGQGLVNTGAGDIVSNLILKILGENPSGLFVGFVFFIVTFIFTQLMSNMALYNIIRPIAILTCAALGYSPLGVVVLCWIGCFTSYLTPMATIAVPLMMDTGGYNQKDLLKAGWVPALLTTVISVPWVMWMLPV